MYILEAAMQVAKWGNSLAVRIPAAVAEALGLKEGDDIQIVLAGDRRFEIERDPTRSKAVARLKALRRPLPKGFKFDRAAAHER
jgi:antitoxin MazE